MAAAEPKPPLVERLFAEHRGGPAEVLSAPYPSQGRCSGSRAGGVRSDAAGERPGVNPQSRALPLHGGQQSGEGACGALDRRQASGIDIEEAPPAEQLETQPEFDGELDARQRVARLGVVLKQLRPKCRAAVELRFTQGLTFREIAMHLGVSPQMAKKYVAQGLSHCRRRMAALG